MSELINLDVPEFAVPEANRIAVNNYPSQMMPIPASRMFEIKKALAKYKETFGTDALCMMPRREMVVQASLVCLPIYWSVPFSYKSNTARHMICPMAQIYSAK